MTVGFEEDSPFYDGPVIDTREDVKSEDIKNEVETPSTQKEEAVVIKKEKVEESAVPKEVELTTEPTIKHSQEIKEKQEEVVQTSKDIVEENETTFSYERDDE